MISILKLIWSKLSSIKWSIFRIFYIPPLIILLFSDIFKSFSNICFFKESQILFYLILKLYFYFNCPHSYFIQFKTFYSYPYNSFKYWIDVFFNLIVLLLSFFYVLLFFFIILHICSFSNYNDDMCSTNTCILFLYS